jgi:ABC-2 type transport system permease protein
MNRLLAAEALKLRSTRSFYTIATGALALIAAAVAATAGAPSFTASDHPGRDTLAIAGIAQTLALVLGVLSMTTEFRYGTITPSLLVTPRRTPLLVAKVANLLAAGFLFGLLAFAGAAGIALPILSARGIGSELNSADVAAVIAGGAVAAALFATLGVGIGAVVRNQVGAIVVALMLYALEPLLTFIPGVGDTVQRFGLGGLSSGASGTSALQSDVDILGQGAGGVRPRDVRRCLRSWRRHGVTQPRRDRMNTAAFVTCDARGIAAGTASFLTERRACPFHGRWRRSRRQLRRPPSASEGSRSQPRSSPSRSGPRRSSGSARRHGSSRPRRSR